MWNVLLLLVVLQIGIGKEQNVSRKEVDVSNRSVHSAVSPLFIIVRYLRFQIIDPI